jgi:hypothetical protein
MEARQKYQAEQEEREERGRSAIAAAVHGARHKFLALCPRTVGREHPLPLIGCCSDGGTGICLVSV